MWRSFIEFHLSCGGEKKERKKRDVDGKVWMAPH
jgi:hypothetical protein